MRVVWLAALLTAASADTGDSKGLSGFELGVTIAVTVVVVSLLGIWLAAIIIKRCRKNNNRVKAKEHRKVGRVFPIKQDKPIKLREDGIQAVQECIICLELVAAKEIKLHPCGHSEFHQKCFRQWVMSARNADNRERCCRCTLSITSYSKYRRPQPVEASSMRPCTNSLPEVVFA